MGNFSQCLMNVAILEDENYPNSRYIFIIYFIRTCDQYLAVSKTRLHLNQAPKKEKNDIKHFNIFNFQFLIFDFDYFQYKKSSILLMFVFI